MKLVDLTHEERQALVVLVHRVVRADGQLTGEEIDAISNLSERIPLDEWRAAVSDARTSGLGRASLSELAGHVERPQARAIILRALRIISEVDGADAAETALIQQVARMWG